MSNGATHLKAWITAILWLISIRFVMGGGLALTLVYLIGTAWLLATCALRYASCQLSCELSVDRDRLYVGETGKVLVRTHYDGPFPVRSSELSFSFPSGLRPLSPTSVAPQPQGDDRASAEFRFVPMVRGRYRVGHCIVTLEDAVGLARRTSSISSCKELLVHPKVCSVDELGIPSKLPFGHRVYRIPVLDSLESPSIMRRHFGRTRANGVNGTIGLQSPQVVMKEVRSTDSTQTMLFVDLCRRDYQGLETNTCEELTVSVAASLAHHICSSGELVGLSLLSRPGSVGPYLEERLRKGTSRVYVPPAKGRDQLEQLLDVLATVRGTDQGHFGECLAYGMRSMAFATKMVIVAPTGTDDIRNYASWAVSRGHRTVVVVCGPETHRDRESDSVAYIHVSLDALRSHGLTEEESDMARRIVSA